MQSFHGNSGVGAAVVWIRQVPFGARYGTVPTSYPGCAHGCSRALSIPIRASERRRRPATSTTIGSRTG